MKILHLESSPGWGGQEIRILKEAEEMRKRGHTLLFAVETGGGLVAKAKEKGFTVYELRFGKRFWFTTLFSLLKILIIHRVELINTHSSKDSWLGGIAGRLTRCKLVRTRHLSTPIKRGLNSYLLYNLLTDAVVTTCQMVVPLILKQAKQKEGRVLSIPTGIDPGAISYKEEEVIAFRNRLNLKKEDILVGMVCFMRSWKGIEEFLQAANVLRKREEIKWVMIGGGHEATYRNRAKELGLEGIVHFTGHLDSPFFAMQALDIFVLLSTAHEGVSQAALQAAFLGKPLITTSTGGLQEVCIDGRSGFIVPAFSAQKVVEAILRLEKSSSLRKELGAFAKEHVEKKFLLSQMVDQMEAIYAKI